MEKFWRSLLISCIFTVVYSEDIINQSPKDVYEDEIVAAEDHEHHRIIIVVPKEMPQHVNHVHTYKLADKGIPLIHSGKVVHDHKHSGKVAHEHGHAGKSSHQHKHVGDYGHQHKHLGYLGHKHFGHVHGVSGGGGHGHGHGHGVRLQQSEHPLLFKAAHNLHLKQQQQQHQQLQQQHQQLQQQHQQLHHQQHQLQVGDYVVQQHGDGGTSGVVGGGGGRGRPVSGRVQFVPSSKPQGLGSFIPAEIVDGRHGVLQQFVAADDDAPKPYDVIHLRVPDRDGPNVVDIDLANNVAKLRTNDNQRPVTANFKTVTQYNKVIGHGRAVPARDEEFDGHSDDEDGGGGSGGAGGGLSLEDVGYRFGEGYRLALDTGGEARDFSAAQEQDEEEVDDFKEPSTAVDDDESLDEGNAYSQAYREQF